MNFIIVLGLIGLLFVFFNIKHMKQRFMAIVIVLLLLFFYVSYVSVTGSADIDYKNVKGYETGARLYFSWLLGLFDNVKGLTGNVVNLDWSSNKSIGAR